MFLIIFVRWLRGTVTFLITGAFPEKLINLCLRNGLPVWGIKHLPEGIEASTNAEHYHRLRPMARQTGTKVRIAKKSGLWVYRHRYRRRKGFLVGMLCAMLLLVVASQFVWRVDINGCIIIPEEELRAELEELGVKPGVWAAKIDARTLEQQLRLNDGRIAWIAINIVGSTAQIELRERDIPPDPIDPDGRVGNVVAACDGQIRYMEVYEGKLVVKIGDTVSAGDIIVSGIMEDQYGNRQFKYARAKVLAHAYEDQDIQVPLKQPKWVTNGEPATKSYLEWGNVRIPMFFPLKMKEQPYSIIWQRESLLPSENLSILKGTTTPVQLQSSEISEHEAKEYAMRQLNALRESSPDSKVISREIEGRCENGIYYLAEHALVEKDIAKEVEILLR
ncbi:MAG TPA: sporulation protein YqfD [Clostridia bacterium]|nr:sporulation protein YqfD [Clostridia bacterium]